MKNSSLALAALLSTICFQTLSAAPLTFTSHKDRAGSLEPVFLQQLRESLGTTICVETGTSNGDTTIQAARIFKQVHTVKRQPAMAKGQKHHFSHQPHVTVYQGSSYEALAKMLPTLKTQGKILFFLNDHYNDRITPKIAEGPASIENVTEIRRELQAIKENGVRDCAILVGDIRRFGTRANNKNYRGHWAYPVLQEVRQTLLEINSNFEFALVGDMLLAYDKSSKNVQLSPLVKACTISRLFDDAQYNEDELLQAEKSIASAQGEERAFLKQLCQNTLGYTYAEFHPLLWSGLLSLDEKKYTDALQAFDTVVARAYDHWRLKHYRMLTKKASVLRLVTRQEFLKIVE